MRLSKLEVTTKTPRRPSVASPSADRDDRARCCTRRPRPPPTQICRSNYSQTGSKLVRQPNLRTKYWLNRPVEVFHVSPKMTKFEIKEYLTKLYNLPVSHVHTAIYEGRKRTSQVDGRKYQEADYKKAYVYLHDSGGRAEAAVPPRRGAKHGGVQGRVARDAASRRARAAQKSERTDDMWTARNRRAQRQKPLSPRPSPYDSIFPNDMKPDD